MCSLKLWGDYKPNNMMYLYNRGCNWSKLHKWFIAPWHGHKLVPHLWLLVRSRRSAKHRGNSLITRAFIRSARCLVFWADVLTALEHSPHCAWMCVCECMFVCVCADRVCVWESECVYVCVCVCKQPPLVLMTTDCHRVWRWTNGILFCFFF